MSEPTNHTLNALTLNLRILAVLVFNLVSYFTIGLVLGVLPSYVHNHLGFSAFWAGLVISVQYIATLITRPTAGRLIDEKGPKIIVIIGLAGLLLSAVFYGLAAWLDKFPIVALTSLILARIILGVGQSFVGTGCMLWGIGRVGAANMGRVISWSGIITYGSMALALPIGVWLMEFAGLLTIAIIIFIVILIAIVIAYISRDVAISSGAKVPFRDVLGKVWLFGFILTLGSVGFGVIATFITLLFEANNWSGAQYALLLFTLAFVGMRLFFPNTISRFGGLNVAVVCFIVEAIGLSLVWLGISPWLVILGAFITGSGFSLVFPSLGVAVINTVSPQSHGSALATYTVFLDLSLGVVGPLAGIMMGYTGIASIYLAAATLSIIGLIITLWLKRKTVLKGEYRIKSG